MRTSVAAALMSLIALAARAAEPAPPPDRLAAEIAPYIDETTLAVACLDLSRVNAEAVAEWLDGVMKDAGAGPPRDPLKPVGPWADAMRKAGATRLYFVLTLGDFPNSPGYTIVPLEQGADADAIARLLGKVEAPASQHLTPGVQALLDPTGNTTARLRDAVVAGSKATVLHMKGLKPAARPNLAKAFAAAGDAPIRLAVVPGDDTRRAFEELMPKFPPQVGGGPVTALTRGLVWAGVGIDLPPKPAVRALVQSENAEHAKAFDALIRSSIKAFAQEQEVRELLPDAEKVLAPLTPKVEADRLTVNADAAVLAAVARQFIPAVMVARSRALRAQSASNVRQILSTIIQYASENKNDYPPDYPSLRAAAKQCGTADVVFVNPMNPTRDPGYVYVPPAGNEAAPADAVVIYEAHDHWGDGINVGFGDGHVEWISSQKQFEKLLADTNAHSEKVRKEQAEKKK